MLGREVAGDLRSVTRRGGTTDDFARNDMLTPFFSVLLNY
jgi:hypothetical protein